VLIVATKKFTYRDYEKLELNIDLARSQANWDRFELAGCKEEKEKAEDLRQYLKFKPKWPFRKETLEQLRKEHCLAFIVGIRAAFGALQNFFYIIFFVVFYPVIWLYRHLTIPAKIRRAEKKLKKAQEKSDKSQAVFEARTNLKTYIDEHYPDFRYQHAHAYVKEREAREHEKIMNNAYTRRVYQEEYRKLTGTMCAEEIKDREIEAIAIEIEEALLDSACLKD